jgi:hypothetical protein
MVMNGGPQMHHQKAPMLSKEWGEGHRFKAATARRLLTIIYKVWKEGRNFIAYRRYLGYLEKFFNGSEKAALWDRLRSRDLMLECVRT